MAMSAEHRSALYRQWSRLNMSEKILEWNDKSQTNKLNLIIMKVPRTRYYLISEIKNCSREIKAPFSYHKVDVIINTVETTT